MSEEKDTDIVNLVVEIPRGLRKKFKSKAAGEGLSLKDKIMSLMEKYVEK